MNTMKTNQKKALYESIMRSVAKEVKKALNEANSTNIAEKERYVYNGEFTDMFYCDVADKALNQEIGTTEIHNIGGIRVKIWSTSLGEEQRIRVLAPYNHYKFDWDQYYGIYGDIEDGSYPFFDEHGFITDEKHAYWID